MHDIWVIIGLGLSALLLCVGAPIFVAFTLGGGLMLIFHFGMSLDTIAQIFFASIDNDSLMAIPFFIIAGTAMTSGGASARLIRLINSFVGHLPGGLALSAVVAAIFFGALSGSHPATAVAIGTMMLPEMAKLGYKKSFSSALICNATTVGIIIPPSIGAIIYGYVTEMSVGKLFIAGIIPGLVMAFFLGITAVYISQRRGFPRSEHSKWPERIRLLIEGGPALFMPVMILGGVYMGIFTATEAGAVAAMYSILIGIFFYRELNLKSLLRVLVHSIIAVGNLFFIVSSCIILGKVFIMLQIPQLLTNTIIDVGIGKLTFVLLAMLALLVLGTFLEALALILVTLPIFIPSMESLGVDPYMFYILTCVAVGIGQATPPVGIVLYIMSDVSQVPVTELFRESIIWLAVLLLSAMIVVFLPSLASWLPSLM